jgi:hypothetical protein
MRVSGEARANEGRQAMSKSEDEGARGRGDGVTTHSDQRALSFHESAWWLKHAVYVGRVMQVVGVASEGERRAHRACREGA